MSGNGGVRVMIVEDEWIVAAMIQQAVEDAGYDVVGPFNSVAKALKAIEAGPPVDAALLDIWLGDERSFPIADELDRCDTPLLFMTGYSAADIPEKYRSHVLLGKPLDPSALLAALRSLLDRAVAEP